jgi:hypothetical protein
MLYLVRLFGNRNFTPLTGQDITASHSIKFAGVKFQGLTNQQLAVLKELKDQEKALIENSEG